MTYSWGQFSCCLVYTTFCLDRLVGSWLSLLSFIHSTKKRALSESTCSWWLIFFFNLISFFPKCITPACSLFFPFFFILDTLQERSDSMCHQDISHPCLLPVIHNSQGMNQHKTPSTKENVIHTWWVLSSCKKWNYVVFRKRNRNVRHGVK